MFSIEGDDDDSDDRDTESHKEHRDVINYRSDENSHVRYKLDGGKRSRRTHHRYHDAETEFQEYDLHHNRSVMILLWA